MGEELKAGAVTVWPSTKNPPELGGEYKWSVQWPQRVIDGAGLMAYEDKLRYLIAHGIGVPPELFEQDVTGGWSGRLIPLLGYYDDQQQNACSLYNAWHEQVGTPLVRWNFGPEAWFTGTVLPLLDLSKIQGQGQPPSGNPPPSSLEGPLPQRSEGLQLATTAKAKLQARLASSLQPAPPKFIPQSLSAISIGEDAHVAGFLVRRIDQTSYRLETPRYVTGATEDIEAHIRREWDMRLFA